MNLIKTVEDSITKYVGKVKELEDHAEKLKQKMQEEYVQRIRK